MGDNSTDNPDSYLRISIITSEHPGKPLDGVVVAAATSHDVSVDEPYFGALMQQAKDRFEIDQYATDLRLGTIYLDATNGAIVGVTWEDTPAVYDDSDFEDPVNELPDDLLAADELLE